jgi:long-chain fatty acid transport protein
MIANRFCRTRVAAAVGGALLTIAAGQAFGAAFALQEQSGSGLGNAFAGGAAVAEDASTIYFNPAGMSRLPGTQIAGAASLICPSAKFSDSGSLPSGSPPFTQPLGGSGGDAGSCAVVPALYLAVPIDKQWAVGLGVNAPFGLKTEYDSNWIGRFQGVESKVDTININPAVSFKASDMVTVGGGVSWQRVKATLTQQVNYQGAIGLAGAANHVPLSALGPILGAYTGAESSGNVNGSDSSWGWNVGLLVEPDKQTRIGIAYRSWIKYTVDGTASFNNPPVPALPPTLAPIATALATGVNNTGLYNGNVSLQLKVPETANLSIFRQVDDKWDVMADLQYTGWQSFQNLTVVRTDGPANGTILTTVPENFKATWRGSIGANYHYTNEWMFRGGLAFDQSPVNNTDRTPRLPDNDRTWFAVGAQYKFNPQWVLDFGYSFIYVKNSSINQNEGSTPTYGLINGTYHNNVNLAALQVTYTFK